MRLVVILGGLSMLCTGAIYAQVATSVPIEEPQLAARPQPSLNFYGLPGLVDMPSAEMLPEGQFTTGISYFAGIRRITLAFQPTDWMTATFRYSGIPGLRNVSTLYDRSFDVRLRLLKERGWWPGVTLGLQDLAGTGIYSGEYFVGTKTFETPGMGAYRLPGRVKVTAGVGWGRLGSHGSFASTGVRPTVGNSGGLGGRPSFNQWFRGPVAAFGGVEWELNDRFGLKVEYSSDGYVQETQDPSVTSPFERKSQFNFGLEYQATERTRVGAYYLYGSEFGLNAQIQLSPYKPITAPRLPAPTPVQQRPDRRVDPQSWSTAWAQSSESAVVLRDRLVPLLEAEGLILESLDVSDVSGEAAELRFRNTRYRSDAVAIGRAARVMAVAMPPSVEIFRLVPMSQGMALSSVVIHRTDLETLEFNQFSSDAMLVETRFSDAPKLAEGAVRAADLYPNFSWSFGPYAAPGFFDPAQPFRIDVGLELNASYRIAPGWIVAGSARQRLAGNLSGAPLQPSNLPPVRTDGGQYAQYGTTLNTLYLSRYWRPGREVFARVSAGYFETAYGGLSTEVLWKPVNSQLALGVEANYALKRDYNQRLGFQDYKVFTGHASAYYDFNNGFHGTVDVGQYLAGDVGATIGIDRVFNNGWSVGGFMTKTNVSAAEFGEGSFDKGIRFSIPMTWFLGTASQRSFDGTIRPIQRDGGARMNVPGRLYERVRGAHRKALSDESPGFWE